VLSLEPFRVKFRIDADRAEPAQFTPDSATIVFHTRELRVEWWSVESAARTGAYELISRRGCIQSALARDGRVLGCVDGLYAILLIDVASGEAIFKKERAYTINLRQILEVWQDGTIDKVKFEYFQLAFFPDSRYFVVGNPTGETVIDVAGRIEAKLPGAIRRAFRQKFTFLGSDRVVTVDPERPERSSVLQFPSGELVKRLTLGSGVTASSHGDYVILRPIKDWPVGLVDLSTGKIVMASKTEAFDSYDRQHLSERPNGEIGLFALDAQRPIAVATLPRARLGTLSAAEITPDLKWIAMSGRDRGGIWNLETGTRVSHVLGFRGAFLAPDGGVYADFPKHTQVREGKPLEQPRTIVRVDIGTGRTRAHVTVEEEHATLRNRYLCALKPSRKDDMTRDVMLEIRDVETGAALWSRKFSKDVPWQYTDVANGRMILEWPLASPSAEDAIDGNPRLREAVRSAKLKDGDAYLEVLNLADGQVIGRLVVNTGRDRSRIKRVVSSGDAVVVSDRHNQVLVYSLLSGERRGTMFGNFAVVSDRSRLIGVQNDVGELKFFDLDTLAPKGQIRLSTEIRAARFSADGTRLLLVSADQMARVLDTQALGH
jgi:hypothetical protein